MVTRLALALAVVAALFSVGGGAPAAAQDRRPCVSNREFHGVHFTPKRSVLEDRWEVRGRGVRFSSDEVSFDYAVSADHPQWFAVRYKMCRHPMSKAVIFVVYSLHRHRPFGVIWWRSNLFGSPYGANLRRA